MFATCSAFSRIPTPRSWNTLSWGRLIFCELQIHNVCTQLVIQCQTLITSLYIYILSGPTFIQSEFYINSLTAALTSFPCCVVLGWLGADLVSVSSSRLFRQIQSTAVSCEAAVRPVSIVKAEWPAALGVTGVLDGDGAWYHGDDTAAACIPFSLMVEGNLKGWEQRERLEGRGKILSVCVCLICRKVINALRIRSSCLFVCTFVDKLAKIHTELVNWW